MAGNAINFQKAEYIKSAAAPGQFIRDGLPQIIFAGRSNVGKSSVINRLLNRKNLAFTGNSPGKTRQVNYFLTDNQFYLTDLPGYGYAKAPESEKLRWAELMESLFQRERAHITAGILIVDIRHKPTKDDEKMREWFRDSDCKLIILANKLDKLKKSQIEPALNLIQDTLKPGEFDKMIPYSAQNGTGNDELRGAICEILGF